MRQLGLVGLKTPIVVEAAVGKDGTVSADHQKMTCKGVLTDGAGHSASYVDVYDRM